MNMILRQVMQPDKSRSMFVAVMNTWGTLALVGGAIYSSILFRRKQILRNRMVGNWLIAPGGLLPAFGGALVSLNLAQFNYLGIMLGVILIFVGYLQTAKATDDARAPRRAATGSRLMSSLRFLHSAHYWLSRAGIAVGLVMLLIAIYHRLDPARRRDQMVPARRLCHDRLYRGRVFDRRWRCTSCGGRPYEDVHLIYGLGALLSLPFFVFVETTAQANARRWAAISGGLLY